MQVQITVEIDAKDGEFFGDLNSGAYSWVSSAQLTFTGIGESPPPVDATWLLRANVLLVPEEPS
jgi:hypothetical protein